MALIVRIGRALWGDRWISPMARVLRINERTVRYWATGRREVPAGILRALAEHLEAHAALCHDLASEVARITDDSRPSS